VTQTNIASALGAGPITQSNTATVTVTQSNTANVR
jgi:hypothetical protein